MNTQDLQNENTTQMDSAQERNDKKDDISNIEINKSEEEVS